MWDDPNQADMCEIVRTLIARGVLRDKKNNAVTLIDLRFKQEEVFDNIECAKYGDGIGICAAAGSS